MDTPGPKAVFWRSFGLFDGLQAEVLDALSAHARRRTWAAGTTLFLRGDPGDWMVALSEGRVKLTLTTPQGRELILRHAEGGDTLGEFALIDAEPRSADATAVLPTSGWVIERGAFDRLVQAHPALAMAAARHVCRLVRDTTGQLEGIALYQLEARLARFLLFTLRQIHGDDPAPDAVLRLDIRQGDLAAMLGASRPKVNRALQSLEELGALTRQGDLWQVDPAALTRIAGQEG